MSNRRPEKKAPCVYILASRRNGTLYIGVTSDLVRRVWQHRNDLVAGFTKRYGVHRLVWYEVHDSMESGHWAGEGAEANGVGCGSCG